MHASISTTLKTKQKIMKIILKSCTNLQWPIRSMDCQFDSIDNYKSLLLHRIYAVTSINHY
jgi:hypothetical protein